MLKGSRRRGSRECGLLVRDIKRTQAVSLTNLQLCDLQGE